MRRANGWTVVVLVALAAAVAQAFGRFSYSVLLPAIRNDLGHTNTIAGLLGTANVAAYLVGTMIVGALSSRIRLMHVLWGGFVFSLSGLALAVVAPNAGVLGLALFSMGLGGALIWIPSPAIASAAVGDRRRGVAVGAIGAGIGTGIVFTGQLSRVLRERSGDGAWRSVYAIETGLGAAAVLAVLLLVRHREAAPLRQGHGGIGFSKLKQMPGWRAIVGCYASYGFCYLLAVSFLTSRLEDDAGYSEGLASTMFTLVGIGTMAGGILLGLIADRVGERPALVVGFVLFACAIGSVLTGVVAVVAVASLMIGLLFGGLPTMVIGYMVRNTTPSTFGPSFAAATFAFGVAQVASPQLGGLIADVTGSFTLVFVIAVGFALCGSFAATRLPHRPSPGLG